MGPLKLPFKLSGDQWAAMILCPTLVVGLGYYIFFWPTNSSSKTVASAAGWDDLALCSELSSFDGEKSLVLHEDGRADLADHTSADNVTKSEGSWKLRDSAKKTYEVEAPGAAGVYTLIEPQDPKQCMLAAGDPDRADLEASWFPSDTFEEPMDEDSPDTSP